MREEVGLAMRQEFLEAADVVEENTGVLTPHFPKDVMEKFHATEAELKNMAARYSGLKINGLADRAGYAVAHAARIELRDARILIDKTRKAETAEAQTYIKTCNSVAKYLTNIIAPAEDALDAEEAAYNAEVEAERGRKQAEANAKIQARVDAFQKVGAPISLAEITLMTDIAFEFALASATEAWEAKEKLRIAAEEALAKQEAERKAAEEKAAQERAQAEKAERERLDKVRAEQEEMARKLVQQKAELDRQAAEIQAKKDAHEREAREEQIRKEEAEKAKAKAEREAKDAAERAERERVEANARARAIEAARPDADKLRALALVFRDTAFPKLSTDAGKAAMVEIENAVTRLAFFIEKKADSLAPVTLNVAP